MPIVVPCVRRLELVEGENAAIWDETRFDWCARVKSSDARFVRVNDTGFLLSIRKLLWMSRTDLIGEKSASSRTVQVRISSADSFLILLVYTVYGYNAKETFLREEERYIYIY